MGRALSRAEVVELCRQADERGDRLYLSGLDLSESDLTNLRFRNVWFGRHEGRGPALLMGTKFGGSHFEDCSFVHAELTKTYFRGCRFVDCDFRFSRFSGAQLADAQILRSDFYRAQLGEGTVMAQVCIQLSSMSSTGLDGTVGLEWQSFKRRGGVPALVQESAALYPQFLQPTETERYPGNTIADALASRLEDAARVYRGLSGLWAGRGSFADAGAAYAYGRRLERQARGPFYRGSRFRPFSWLWLWIADLVCGFGESLPRVVAWIAALALLPGFGYRLFGGIVGAHGLLDDLLYSLSSLTASQPSGLGAANRLVSWIGVAQTFLGVALLGLFGFVLGNKIRNS
jgi:Pentapeptide repeats (9 copies)